QAEVGIRDFHVTGVQTCALPISARFPRISISDLKVSRFSDNPEIRRDFPAFLFFSIRFASLLLTRSIWSAGSVVISCPKAITARSEERRVGREYRTRENA